MPPVRRHRIGDQMPAVTHAGPDPNTIALCRDLVAEVPPVDCAILFAGLCTFEPRRWAYL